MNARPHASAARRAALVVTVAAAALAAAFAQPAATLQPARGELVFVSRQMGAPVEGRFTRFDAQAALDPGQPERGRAAITVELASATLGHADVDAELRSAGWFDVARHPTAGFRAESIRAAGAGRVELRGPLTFKGRSRELVVPVTLSAQPGGATLASGSFSIRRLDFGIGAGEWSDTSLVADEVQVRFRLVLSAVPGS